MLIRCSERQEVVLDAGEVVNKEYWTANMLIQLEQSDKCGVQAAWAVTQAEGLCEERASVLLVRISARCLLCFTPSPASPIPIHEVDQPSLYPSLSWSSLALAQRVRIYVHAQA